LKSSSSDTKEQQGDRWVLKSGPSAKEKFVRVVVEGEGQCVSALYLGSTHFDSAVANIEPVLTLHIEK
jgi:hypothetical protein